MRRLSLSTKLLAAALPLVVAVGLLLVLTVRSDLQTIDRAESGADLGSVWNPLIESFNAMQLEADEVSLAEDVSISDQVSGVGSQPAVTADPELRRATDQAMNSLRDAVERLDSFDAAAAHVTDSRSALSAGRRASDMAVIAPQMTPEIEPTKAYEQARTELVAIGRLLPAEAGDSQLGRELLAVSTLADARLHADDVIENAARWPNLTRDTSPLARASDAFTSMSAALGEFESLAPEEWSAEFRQTGFAAAMSAFGSDLDSVVRAANVGRVERFDTDAFQQFTNETVEFQRGISEAIVERANAQADQTRSAALIRIGAILLAVLIAAIVAWVITRSITRRVKEVADSANQVATTQLPALVEALRDPRGNAVLPAIDPVDAKGSDDLAELAGAFNSMQSTLTDVAQQQVEVLRRGVSDLFVTMARRNRSLIDRQLAALDEYEASVDDPEILSNYYQLDHLATRMRRNSESLLVLANAESRQRRMKPTEIDDVVRASIGEVEDYRRIEIQHLETLQVRGNVVADVSHLLAELLDNATSFSPPGSPVRVGGRRANDSYMLRVVDDGVGISADRIVELNRVLREPPVVGLSVESTLGLSVVSLLANKHGIEVTLSNGEPGLTVDVILPSSLFGPAEQPSQLEPAPTTPATESISVPDTPEALVDWEAESKSGPEVATEAPPSVTYEVEPTPSFDSTSFDSTSFDTPVDDTPSLDNTSFESTTPVEESTPSFEVPSFDTPVAEAPSFDTPVAETPDLDTPSFDTPVAEAPSFDTPSFDTPSFDTPSFDTPSFDTPSFDAPAEHPAPAASAPAFDLAPPSALSDPTPAAPPQAEFDVPPAPPIGANGLAQRPVTPDVARPAPAPTPPAAPDADDAAPLLPTRTSRGSGPDGPDRLADANSDAPRVAQSEPQALQAALAAFDSGRAAGSSGALSDLDLSLPTRAPVTETVAPSDDVAVTQSSIDPGALRDRLRAFQSEFHGSDNGAASLDNHTDFGDSAR